MLNFLDRAILYLSPSLAARRLYIRTLIERNVRGYEAAGKGRRWKNQKAPGSDAERENVTALSTVRNRARDLVRNNWIAGRAVDAIIANTIGHGIEASIPSKGKVLNLWNEWARTKEIDHDGVFDFFGLQQIAMGSIVESGDVIMKKVRVTGGVVPLKIQLLEGDYIDVSRLGAAEVKENQIRNGIEFDPQGRVVAYYLFDRHPGAVYPGARLSSTRYPVSDVRLLYRKKRLGQVRGMSWFANVMLKVRDLDDYDDAQLFRQKIAACFTGFIESTDIPLNSSTDDADPISEKMEPGVIEVLPPGKKMSFSQPPGVGADYDPFIRRQLMAVASGMGITYEALTGDYSNVNFSSGRMGWIEFYRNIEMWRWGMFVPMFCETAWEWFVEAAEVAGLLDSTRVKPPTWSTPRREMIDPVKETAALKDQVRSGFVSYSESLREMGKDPDAHMAEVSEDFKKLDKLGLTIEADPRFNLKGGNSSNANNQETGGSSDSSGGSSSSASE